MPLKAVRSESCAHGLLAGTARPRLEPTDEELVDAVRRGDHRVAGLLYDRVVDGVERALFRVFGCRERDHDDLVQTVFEQIIVTLKRNTYAKACSLKTWASSIAAHVALNSIRSRRVERRVFDRSASIETLVQAARVDVEATAGARLELDRVRHELARLSSQKAQAVMLHDVLGHSLAEIALMHSVPISTVQTRLVRGRRELWQRYHASTGAAPVERIRRRGPSVPSAAGADSARCAPSSFRTPEDPKRSRSAKSPIRDPVITSS
jgi:RNA polymerase sigma-70 factor (ECF subfamily)